MAYISNKLTHWVGAKAKDQDAQYAILVDSILKERRLLYGRSPWHFRSKYGGVKNHTIPMICFTDIPFSECAIHCEKYSKFGVSFDKRYLANCLASPVGYVLNPFVHQAYSDLFHGLHSLSEHLERHGSPYWERTTDGKTKRYDTRMLLSRLQCIMSFHEDYSEQEFEYNEDRPDPLDRQHDFFEKADALYFEREWRMLLQTGGSRLCWQKQIGDGWYFEFNDKYLDYVIVPKSYLPRFRSEQDRVFAHYSHVPQVLAFEDLQRM